MALVAGNALAVVRAALRAARGAEAEAAVSGYYLADEAFRFYLPAYLIADVDGRLDRHDPVFHLTHGLTDGVKNDRVNPRCYGERTWFEEKGHKFAVFDRAQAQALVSYLRFKREVDAF